MLKGRTVGELTAVPQDTFPGQHFVDAVHPFLQIAAAALDDQALRAFHAAQVVCGNMLDTHNFAFSGRFPAKK